MAEGLRSLKYGIGDQTTSNPSWTKQDLKNMGLLAANIISPAHDIQEYQTGVERTLRGDLWGLPQGLAGLLGIAIPGSKYIKKWTSKLIDRIVPSKKPTTVSRDIDTPPKEKIPEGQEIKVFHGTKHPYKQDIFQTPDNVLYTTRNPHEASLIAKNASPQDFGTYSTSSSTNDTFSANSSKTSFTITTTSSTTLAQLRDSINNTVSDSDSDDKSRCS